MLDSRHTELSVLVQIRERLLAVLLVKEAVAEELCRLEIHFIKSLSRHTLLCTRVVGRNADSRSLREYLDSRAVIHVLGTHNECYGISARSATEAIKALGRGKHGKGRCFFIMERAESVEVRARSFQSDVRAYHLLNVASVYYLVNYLSWDLAHLIPFHTFGIQRSV